MNGEVNDQVFGLAQDYELLKNKLKKLQGRLRTTNLAFGVVIIFMLILGVLCIAYGSSLNQEKLEEYKVLFEESQANFRKSQANFRILKSQFDTLNHTLKTQIESLEDEIEESKFYFYYRYGREQRYGVDDLESYLDRWQWSDESYTEGKFDCSEMSAEIERVLENEGYHTIIVVGRCPFNQTGKHAWLLVEAVEGKYMPVEPTTYSLVKWADPNFDFYFQYDHEFETIFDALEFDYDEFDWWES